MFATRPHIGDMLTWMAPLSSTGWGFSSESRSVGANNFNHKKLVYDTQITSNNYIVGL